MAGTVEMTLSQLFKAKGGYIRHNVEQNVVRIEMKVGSSTFVGRTGADLQGFRYLEGLMRDKLYGRSYTVEPTSKSVMGIDMRFLGVLVPEGGFEERITALQRLISEQRAKYDSKGFLVYKEKVKGTPSQFFDGEDMDILVCPNEKSKKRMEKVMADESGQWFDLEFHFDSTDNLDTECDYIISAWDAAEFVNNPPKEIKADGNENEKYDWYEEVLAEQTESNLTSIREGMVDLFLKSLRKPHSSMPQHERDKIFWGNGNPPVSSKLKDSLVRKSFPADNRMPISDFMSRVKTSLVNEWGFDSHKSQMGDVDLGLLVVGQMLRVKGFLDVRFAEKTVEYVPRPANYLASQSRMNKKE